MTNPTTGPTNASGSSEQKKHTPDLASAPKSPPPVQVPAKGSEPAIAPAAVKAPAPAQSQTPSPASGPKGPVVIDSTPTQNQGVREPKGDENRKAAAPASVAVRAGGTDPTPPVRAVSSDTPAPAAPRASQTGPGDPRPIGPNDPVKPTPFVPVQSVHRDTPSGASAAGDANAAT
jgi:hypothetical protein